MARKQLSATEKLRRNVSATIRRAEKKGFTFTDEVKAKVKSGSYQTLKSLQGNRYKNLYSQSKVEGAGASFSGTYYRNVIAPRVAAAKAAETRKSKGSEEFLKKRREKDKAEKAKAKNFAEGQIIFAQMLQLIKEHDTPGAKALNAMLKEEIGSYGFDNVMRSVANAPSSIIADARTLVRYKESKAVHQRAYHNLTKIIKGSRLTESEGKAVGNYMDQV